MNAVNKTRFLCTLIPCCLLLPPLVQTEGAPNASSLRWGEGAPPPRAKAGQLVGWCGPEIICAGGTWWEGPTKRYTEEVHAYDPAQDRWRSLPPFPLPIAYSGVVTIGGDLIVAGGWTGKAPVLHCYRLRPGESSRWDPLPDLPGPRVFSSAAAVGSVVYLMGGCVDFNMTGGPTATMVRLDLRKLKSGWQSCPPLPGPARSTFCAAACGGKIYVFGGYTTGSDTPPGLSDAYSYDPKTDRWTRLANLPGTNYAACAVSKDRRHVFVLGGVDTDRPTTNAEGQTEYPFADQTLVYDTRNNTYSVESALTHPIAADQALTDGKRLYVLGGEVGFHVRSPWTFVGSTR